MFDKKKINKKGASSLVNKKEAESLMDLFYIVHECVGVKNGKRQTKCNKTLIFNKKQTFFIKLITYPNCWLFYLRFYLHFTLFYLFY